MKGSPEEKRCFVSLYHDVIDGYVTRMSDRAAKLLILVCRGHNGFNNGAILLGTAEAGRLLGCSRSSAFRAFRELEALGLIQQTRKGDFNTRAGALKAAAATWRILFYPTVVRDKKAA